MTVDGDPVGEALVGRQRVGPRLLLEELAVGLFEQRLLARALGLLAIAFGQRVGDSGDQQGDHQQAQPFPETYRKQTGQKSHAALPFGAPYTQNSAIDGK